MWKHDEVRVKMHGSNGMLSLNKYFSLYITQWLTAINHTGYWTCCSLAADNDTTGFLWATE